MKIIVAGSLAFDRIMNFPGLFSDHILPDQIHNLNVAFDIEHLEVQYGGTAGNVAYTLSLLQEPAQIFASTGSDFESYRVRLEKQGIATSGIEEHEDRLTATAHIITDRGNNQITAFSVGAMGYPTTSHIPTDNPAQTFVVISAGNIQDMQRYASECQAANVSYLFDPGQKLPALSKEELIKMLRGAAYCIVNDYEYQLMLQKMSFSHDVLVGMVTNAFIVTKGHEGSVAWSAQHGEERANICTPVDVVDPTGAGDAYRAGFLKAIFHSMSLRQAMQCGATAAAFAIEHIGTQQHHFTINEFCARYYEAFHEPILL